MGTFFHPITIVGPDGEETVDALVDTGADFTTLPAPLVQRLGVKPFRDARMRLAGESTAVWSLCRVTSRINGEDGPDIFIFGSPDSPPVIRGYTLEGMLLGVGEGGLSQRDGFA
jgi:predicted aspartyl protease